MAFSTSANFTVGQTWGRSENRRSVFTPAPMSGPVAFKRIIVSDVSLVPSVGRYR